MGQKVNPIGIRLGIVKTWESRWFGGKNYAQYILEDHKLRKFIKKKLFHAGVSRIEIERSSRRVRLRIFTSRPGIVIGKKGAEISQLKKDLEKMTAHEVMIDIQEIRKPEIEAQLVAENVALQIERRVAFRRAMKRGVSSAMRFGALGVKIICSGRLGGSEMSRKETQKLGSIPLHTLDANVDYAIATSRTTYGAIGIKVWIYKGKFGEEIAPTHRRRPPRRVGQAARGTGGRPRMAPRKEVTAAPGPDVTAEPNVSAPPEESKEAGSSEVKES